MRDNQFQVIDNTVAVALASFERAAKSGYGKRYTKLTEAELKAIDDALHGGSSLGRLPDDMREVVAAMRQSIDGLSDKYVAILRAQVAELRAAGKKGDNAAAVRAEMLQDVILRNKGKYVTRAYRAFDDPLWFKKIPAEARNAGYAFLLNQYNGDRRKAEHTYTVLVKGEGKAYDSMEALIKESTLGAKDLSILKKRNDIAPEIRALLGEYTDPQMNYARTMLKMSRLIWNTEFLDGLLKKGLGNFLWKEGTQPPEANMKMAGTNSRVLEPLNDLWTTPEVKQAMEDAVSSNSALGWWGTIIGLNGLVKAGKILYSPPTQVRNVASAAFFGIQGGSLDIRQVGPALAMMNNQIRNRGGSIADQYNHYVEIGLTHDTPNAGMVQDLMADGKGILDAIEFHSENIVGKNIVEPITTRGKKFHKVVSNLYRAGDDIWKIIIFESQLADYMKAKPTLSRAEAEPIVAKRVRDTVPTYSLVGPGMKWLGRLPLVGPFVAFSSEIIRTSANNLKLIKSDLADPDLKNLAYRRMAGTALAHGWAAGAAALSAAAFGVDGDEEEALRKVGLGPWAKNSDIVFLGRNKDGQLRTLDLSYIDPYNIFHKPLTALTRNQPWLDSFLQSAAEVLMPFVQPDIAATAIGEAVVNKKMRNGAPVYNEHAPGSDKAGEIAKHLFFQMGPGVVLPLRKITNAIMGDRDPTGRVYDLKWEAAGMFGLKISTFDPKFSMYFRVGDFKDALGDANKYLYNIAGGINPRDRDELKDAFETADAIRVDAYNDMLEIVNAAKKSGLNTTQVRKILRLSNVSKRYSNALARGQEAPSWRLGKTFMKGNVARAKLLIDRETALDLKGRQRDVRQMAREAARQ